MSRLSSRLFRGSREGNLLLTIVYTLRLNLHI